ncbi:MAG: cytochrome c nitrite reductase small subunit [Elusimicrobiota bacterium]|nr:cytochrome c nitrite reductase small subunit [Elusimicrobiota bacterium]
MHFTTRRLFLAFAAGCGVFLGFAVYTFVYARGYSYLTDDPRACANCHVMNDQYAGWVKAPHRSVAVCNDCHTPANLVGKYAVKAKNGFWHSYYFTTQTFHEPIAITNSARAVALDNCRRCHEPVVTAIDGPHNNTKRLDCLRCHQGVGH